MNYNVPLTKETKLPGILLAITSTIPFPKQQFHYILDNSLASRRE